jgi:hypothetical protein
MSLHVYTHLPLCQFSSSRKVDPEQRRDAVDNQELERLLGHLGSETKKKTELVFMSVRTSINNLQRELLSTSENTNI